MRVKAKWADGERVECAFTKLAQQTTDGELSRTER